MANLRPARTGLPMVVWVQERGNARHDVRVKVCRVHGDSRYYPDGPGSESLRKFPKRYKNPVTRGQFNNTVSVAVRPEPHLVAGQLSPVDLDAVIRWITLNTDALVAYWNGDIDTGDLLELLLRLDPPIAP